ncbi:hypothetical protein C2G38_2237474 [Gigaspora rosea]|uniref:Uncharacterized protein n=1 Tax=Gigaspora rosea TaxID=44941 RepID=A0A397TPD2_9GLOM|nr:hypothetical protein C2G38_2237474 [Gigaspora rosea]
MTQKVDEIINRYIEDEGMKEKLSFIAEKLEKCKEVEIFMGSSVDTKAQGLEKKS